MSDLVYDWLFSGGHYPNQKKLNGERGTSIAGRNAWSLGNGTMQAWNGMLNTLVAGATCAMLVQRKSGGLNGAGTVIGFRENAVIFVGSGTVLWDGVQVGVAITNLQILKDGIVYLLGLTAPGGVTITDSGLPGQIQGYISVKWTWFRSATGEESNAGDDAQSNSLYLAGKKVNVPVPGAPAGTVGNSTTPATSNGGVDRARLYSSFPGFSKQGPWFWTGEETSAFGTTLTLDWSVGRQASIGKLAPIDHNPPPACSHASVLAGIILAVGARGSGGGAGGHSVAPSLQYTLGWNPTMEIFLRPGEPVTACKGEMAMDGYVVIACANSTHGVLYAPNEIGPIIHRTISPQVGFPDNDALCVVGDGELWGAATDGRFVRSTQGGFDTTFSYPIYSEVKGLGGWVVGWDEIHDKVLFCSGSTAWAYDRGAPGDVWSLPLDLPGAIQSAVTVAGVLHLVIGGQLYRFNEGSGGYSFAQVVGPFQSIEHGNKILTEASLSAECPVSYRMLTDLDTSKLAHSLATFNADPQTRSVSGAGAYRSRADQIFVQGESFAPELRWTQPGGVIYGIEVRGAGDESWI